MIISNYTVVDPGCAPPGGGLGDSALTTLAPWDYMTTCGGPVAISRTYSDKRASTTRSRRRLPTYSSIAQPSGYRAYSDSIVVRKVGHTAHERPVRDAAPWQPVRDVSRRS